MIADPDYDWTDGKSAQKGNADLILKTSPFGFSATKHLTYNLSNYHHYFSRSLY